MDDIHKEKILQLADHLETLPRYRFHLGRRLKPLSAPEPNPDPYQAALYIYNCETVGGIAGYACLLFVDPGRHDNPGEMPYFGMDFAGEAQHLLGLDDDQADALFMPSAKDGMLAEYQDVTNQHAAITLRNLATTGRVDWSHVAP